MSTHSWWILFEMSLLIGCCTYHLNGMTGIPGRFFVYQNICRPFHPSRWNASNIQFKKYQKNGIVCNLFQDIVRKFFFKKFGSAKTSPFYLNSFGCKQTCNWLKHLNIKNQMECVCSGFFNSKEFSSYKLQECAV